MNKDRTENLNMRVCVRTINGKNAPRRWEIVERKTLIPRDLMHLASQGKVLKDNKTKEPGDTKEMSLRLKKGEKEEPMDTSETEEDIKKRS